MNLIKLTDCAYINPEMVSSVYTEPSPKERSPEWVHPVFVTLTGGAYKSFCIQVFETREEAVAKIREITEYLMQECGE